MFGLFSRKGPDGETVDLLEPPSYLVQPAPVPTITKDNTSARKIGLTLPELPVLEWVAYGLGAVILFLTFEALFSGTTLITPLRDGLVLETTTFGAALGFAAGVWLWFTKLDAKVNFFVTVAGFMMLLSSWFHVVTWRVADLSEFAFSDAPWEQAQYRVTGFDFARKGRRNSISIDPFDAGDAEIPIPKWQYDKHFVDVGDICVTVWQRVSPSGAIQIRTDGEFTLFEPEAVQLTPCPFDRLPENPLERRRFRP